MKFDGFDIHAETRIMDAYCECGKELRDVPNGWFSRALFCPSCENVYVIKKIKYPKKKVDKKFLQECRFHVECDKRKKELHQTLRKEMGI